MSINFYTMPTFYTLSFHFLPSIFVNIFSMTLIRNKFLRDIQQIGSMYFTRLNISFLTKSGLPIFINTSAEVFFWPKTVVLHSVA